MLTYIVSLRIIFSHQTSGMSVSIYYFAATSPITFFRPLHKQARFLFTVRKRALLKKRIRVTFLRKFVEIESFYSINWGISSKYRINPFDSSKKQTENKSSKDFSSAEKLCMKHCWFMKSRKTNKNKRNDSVPFAKKSRLETEVVTAMKTKILRKSHHQLLFFALQI